MSLRRPLVLINGTTQELPSSDSILGGAWVLAGTIIRSGTTCPEGFLRCDGSLLSQTAYPELYAAIGQDFAWIANRYNCGQPWCQQYNFNMTDPGNLSWTTGTSLPSAYYSSPAVVTNSRIYLLGGYTGSSATSTVYQTTINSDGTIGTWTTGTALPVAAYDTSAVVIGSKVYLMGLRTGTSTTLSTVYVSNINADGTLAGWNTTNSLPGALSSSAAVVTNSRIYLFGGNTGGTTVATVYTAPINADGTLGTWTTGTNLPAALQQLTPIVTNSRVYLIGGYTGTSATSTVYTAPINADGTIGTWTTVTSLPSLFMHSAPLVTNSRVYLIGGYVSSASSIVYTAPINADGTIGTWTTGNSLPAGLRLTRPVVTNSRIYLFGGNTASGGVSTVYTASCTGGLNNYMNMSFSRSDIGSGFFLPDLRNEDLLVPDESCRHYIKY